MLTLRTLGSLSLTGLDGEELKPILSQPKRFALLVYLAVAKPRGLHRRDLLLTLFWPEYGEARARNSLSQSLSFLGRNLPADLIIRRGAEEIGVDADLMSSDAARLRSAVQECRWVEALQLYGGDFLSGFHVTGAAGFEEWMQVERDRLRDAAARSAWALAFDQVRRGAPLEAERSAKRAMRLVCPDEETVRRFMEVMTERGDRVVALRFFDQFSATLREVLDLEPSSELKWIEERLRSKEKWVTHGQSGPQDGPASVPSRSGLLGDRPSKADGWIFAGRERELAHLDHALDRALAGHGTVAFITGEAGTGKTVLAREFCSRSISAYPDLVAATGSCDAYTSLGDAYRPFREIVRLLTGDVEAHWMAGSMSSDQATRLWDLFPVSVGAILDEGPDLIDTFVPARDLADRASAFGAEGARLRSGVETIGNNRGDGQWAPAQTSLFEYLLRVLRALAREHPLLLILEDLQWADSGSLDMLFHLGRNLRGTRILVVGIYRPSEVAAGRNGERHPLQKVESELRMSWGDMRVALGETDDRPFLDAVIDSVPNRLGTTFRDSLFHLTRGHALFTVELLRELQDEGKIRTDEDGCWVEGECIEWDRIPAKIDAVIEERISRLPEPLRRVLAVASVEGEQFTAEVVAAVLGQDPSELVALVGGEMEKRHRLVQTVSVERLPGHRISTYRFRNILFQKFLYDRMDPAERVYLHERVGRVLEDLMGDRLEGHLLALGRHFREAGLVEEAVGYFQLSAEINHRAAAYRECMDLLEDAWHLVSTVPESVDRNQRELSILSRLCPTHLILGVMNDESEAALSRLKALASNVQDTDSLFEVKASEFAQYHYLGEHGKGRRVLDEMEAHISRSRQDGYWAQLQLFRGLNAHALGQPRRAVRHLEKCEAVCAGVDGLSFPSMGMTTPLSVALALRALALGPLGFPERGDECLRAAHDLLEAQSDPSGALWVVSYELLLRWILRDAEACCRVTDSYAVVAERLDNEGWASLGRFSRGWCASESGDVEKGIGLMRSAISELDREGWLVWRPLLHSLLAKPLCQIGNAEEALGLMDLSLERIEKTGGRGEESEVNRVRGEVLLSHPKPDLPGAEAAFRRAIAVARKQETKLYELRSTTSLARLLRSQGREKEARKTLRKCFGWFTEGFEYRDLKEARALLDELG